MDPRTRTHADISITVCQGSCSASKATLLRCLIDRIVRSSISHHRAQLHKALSTNSTRNDAMSLYGCGQHLATFIGGMRAHEMNFYRRGEAVKWGSPCATPSWLVLAPIPIAGPHALV